MLVYPASPDPPQPPTQPPYIMIIGEDPPYLLLPTLLPTLLSHLLHLLLLLIITQFRRECGQLVRSLG